MPIPSTPSDVQALTDSPVSANSSQTTVDDAALAAGFIQADLNRLALKLAKLLIRCDTACSPWRAVCSQCLSAWVEGCTPRHADGCIAGDIVELVAQLVALRDAAARERDLAAIDADLAASNLTAFVTRHTESPCPYCGPVCYRGAAHNARVEDGYFFRPEAAERRIEYLPDPGRLVAARSCTHDEAAARLRSLAMGAGA